MISGRKFKKYFFLPAILICGTVFAYFFVKVFS